MVVSAPAVLTVGAAAQDTISLPVLIATKLWLSGLVRFEDDADFSTTSVLDSGRIEPNLLRDSRREHPFPTLCHPL